MRKRNFSIVALACLFSAPLLFGQKFGDDYQGFHTDYRKGTPKLQIGIDFRETKAATPVKTAKRFIKDFAHAYKVKPEELVLSRVKRSLMRTHFYFKQVVAGTEVKNGGFIVTTLDADGSINQVYNNYYPNIRPCDQSSKASCVKPKPSSKETAFDQAWQNIKAHGQLQDAPTAKLQYVVDEEGASSLAYVTYLHVSAPLGAWEHVVDANSGKVISRRDTRVERIETDINAQIDMYRGPIADRKQAFANFERKSQLLRLREAAEESITYERADGTGLVFDPDPRTTLADASIQDEDSDNVFANAYLMRDLKDLSFDGSNYLLKGPWITIKDFESPNSPPSTTTDGNWSSKRGNNAFNDAMTYFHVDQSQRYMQSLGFTGEKGIQYGSIEVDSDGVGGADNSHYIPLTNRMAFGHGCVDDNEDADVILHEYGHAINFSINNDFEGGDSGAMGEGFGDYWAGSYSITTPNGMSENPNLVYSWDGNPCWPGRIMNAMNLRYDHKKKHQAHASMGGGRATDELWSTPLFQTLLELKSRGVDRSEVDRIILDAQFGLGYGLKMRDMANAIIATSERLYPQGQHASVFTQKFLHHKIIVMPAAEFKTSDLIVNEPGNNGNVDPGEAATLMLELENIGTADAESVTAVLSSTSAGVTITNNTATFGSLSMGSTATASNAFAFEVADTFPCGAEIAFDVDLSFVGGASKSQKLSLNLPTGVALGYELNEVKDTPIPDNDPTGVALTMEVLEDMTVSEDFTVSFDATHTYTSDLVIELVSPSGKAVILRERKGGSDEDVHDVYTAADPAGSLKDFIGEPAKGTWTLRVRDEVELDKGTIHSWSMKDIYGYACE